MTLGKDKLLAMAVQKYPGIYDKSHKSHKEKYVVQNAWEAVADELDFVEDGNNFFCDFQCFYWLYILLISPPPMFFFNTLAHHL